MGIEGFNLASEEKFEDKERTKLELKQQIQRSFLAHNFSPDKADKMIEWISNQENSDRLSSLFDKLYAEHVDFGYLWDTNPDVVLEMLNENLRDTMDTTEDRLRKAA